MRFTKSIFTALVILPLLFSCKEKKGKETIVVKETTTVTPAEENKGALERVGDAVDNRVNKEIDEEIERIED